MFRGASKEMKDSRHYLKHKKLRLDIRRNIFSVRTVKNSNKLPREVVQSPSMDFSTTYWIKFRPNMV